MHLQHLPDSPGVGSSLQSQCHPDIRVVHIQRGFLDLRHHPDIRNQRSSVWPGRFPAEPDKYNHGVYHTWNHRCGRSMLSIFELAYIQIDGLGHLQDTGSE